MSDPTVATVGAVTRILVIGDSDRATAAATTLESALSERSVLVSSTAAAAVERLDEVDVACVLYDASSGDTGALVAGIRRRDDALPVLALTAADDGADRAIEAGASDVVRETDPPELLLRRVETAVERYRAAGPSSTDARARAILERAAVPVLVTDDTGTIRYASPAIEGETGHTPEELERRDLARFAHPNDREAVREVIASAREAPLGSTRRISARFRHADGTTHGYELRATTRLEDPAVEGVVVALVDAGAGRPPGEIESAFDRLEDAVLALGDDWTITYANGAATRLLGGDGESIRGTVVWDLLSESATGTVYERLREAIERDEPVEFEFEHPSAGGAADPGPGPGPDPDANADAADVGRVVATAYPGETGVSLVVRDAADSDRIAQRRDRAETLEGVVDALADGALVLEGGTVVHANAAAFELTGAGALVGRDVVDVLGSEIGEAVVERARSSVVRRTDPIEGEIDRDGDSRPVSVTVAPLPVADRVVCLLADDADRRRLSRALSALSRAVPRLQAAETRPDVARILTDAVRDGFAVDAVAFYGVEGESLRPVEFATAESTPALEFPALPAVDSALADALESGESTVLERDRSGAPFDRLGIRADRALVAPVGERGLLLAVTDDRAALGERARPLVDVLAATGAAALSRLERLSALRERERELDGERERLSRLEELYGARREFDAALEGARAREDVERELCEALASIDRIAFAWVGTADVGADVLEPGARSGDDDGYLEAVSTGVDPAGEPTARAVATREPVLVGSVAREPTEAGWRREALERGFQSVLAVPLIYDEFVYGVVAVYATRPGAFDEATRATVTGFGAAAAVAINAAETKRALLADTVTELEVALGDASPEAALADATGSAVDVQFVAPRSDGATTVYLLVPGADLETLERAAADVPSVISIEPVGDRDGGRAYRAVIAGETLAEAVAEHGCSLRSVSPNGERLRALVDVPVGIAVGSFVRALERAFPGVELIARRERARPVQTGRSFRTTVRDRLTERQLRALEAAYYGGFFEWPREQTGEEIAASLDISQPTFNRHFRAAERKLFSLLFDEDD